MKPFRSRLALLLSLLAFAPLSGLHSADTPPRLKRADSFLGIHFDFHAGPDCTEVGRNTTPAMINRIIDLVHPDYLQIDCKGHPGFSSYPTKVGNPVPGFVGDPLRVWRDVTAARGVGLYMHYSGVYDSHAVKQPGWAAVDAAGQPSTKATSFWGPYAQQLLIPQLRELAGVYGVDGAWVDGECWSAVVDYSPAAITAFQTATGIRDVPRKAGEPHWFEFLQFHRESFRRYLRDYVTAVNRTHPDFQLCSNWAFTDHMPEPVSAPLAFLSGDYAPDNSVNSARLSARFLAQQGKSWDLMAWSFSNKAVAGQKTQKTAAQLQREAAVVLAQGGGFQAYYKQKRDGSIFDEQMPVMAEVAAFCRARQALSHHAQSVPQIAVLLSQEDHYRRNTGLFSRNLTRVNGVLQALLESQQAVDVVGEHHLTGNLARYPLIVVPECDYLTPAFHDELVAYAKNGGSLLLVGPGTAGLFARELNASVTGPLSGSIPLRLEHNGATVDIAARWQALSPAPGLRPLGLITPITPASTTKAAKTAKAAVVPPSSPLPAAYVTSFGRGRIAAILFTAGTTYPKDRPPVLRDFIAAVARELFPQPLAEVTGSHDVDVIVAQNHGQVMVHLINTSGPHATQSIIESIAPVGPLALSLRVDRPPARVTLEPGARVLPFTAANGAIRVTVPSVAIHDIVVLHER